MRSSNGANSRVWKNLHSNMENVHEVHVFIPRRNVRDVFVGRMGDVARSKRGNGFQRRCVGCRSDGSGFLPGGGLSSVQRGTVQGWVSGGLPDLHTSRVRPGLRCEVHTVRFVQRLRRKVLRRTKQLLCGQGRKWRQSSRCGSPIWWSEGQPRVIRLSHRT